jgi:flagellin
LRVNSAKDDAAGLAIADRMNTQVRGMNVAIRNANDGISLAQVAEGGLAVVTDILQRMRELSVQSVNSTNTSADISALNQEYGQLSQELARNMSSVEFNGTPLFTTTSDFTFQVGANVGQTVTVGSADLGVASGDITGVLPNSGAASGLDTLVNANNSANISALDAALSAVNSSRATLGAIQSRFSQTITYLQTAVENQTAARGRIMDADFAAETANLSRAQILQQAGTAMIAQANQMPQQVLQLLK